MLRYNRICLLLTLLTSVWCEEHTNHGPNVPHTVGGQHNAEFDHQAVLGSEDLEDEFDGLHPEEARARLQKLVEKHDLNNDGEISKDEMDKWITNSFLNLDHEEGMEKFQEEDENKDKIVSWEEYLEKVYGFSSAEVDEMRKKVSSAGEKTDEVRETESSLQLVKEDLRFFQTADQNGDGGLNPEEYMAFFFPHNYEHMHKLEVERYMDQNDANKDGKIAMAEFVPEDATDESRISFEENFADLDKDKDGLLTEAEVKEWVIPGADELAEEEAQHLISMADTNQDGQLSMNEILDKTVEFVGSSATDYGNLLRHEEL